MVFFVFSGILGPSGRFSPTRQIPPADRWERWGESGGLVKIDDWPQNRAKTAGGWPSQPGRPCECPASERLLIGWVDGWTAGRLDGWTDPPKSAKNRS